MSEFYSYCRFDENCHSTLKKFVGVLEKVGKYRLSLAMHQWYQKAFKPVEMLEQKIQLCDKFSRQKLLAKCWADWRIKQNTREDFYETKGKACQIIWFWKVKDIKKEQLRAFVMWRDQMKTEEQRERRLKMLVFDKMLNQVDQAFQKWRFYAKNLTHQVRLHILVQEYTHD